MSRIRSKNTKPEILVRRFLFAQGLRYRLHVGTLPGKPDLVFPKYRTVIFIHGCFWHGHIGCRFFVIPQTRTEWWVQKIARNKELDKINIKNLKQMGWKVITLFECKLKPKNKDRTLGNLLTKLNKQ